MASRDWYRVLGVKPGASPEEIRAAYRRLAARLHPDHAGQAGTGAFQELGEAYATLSDPEKRRVYDLERDAGRRAPEGGARVPAQALVAEPLVVRKRPRAQGLNLEVVLSSEEAARGLELPLVVPSLQLCPSCGGSGRVWLFPCTDCAEGVVERHAPVRVQIPAMVRPGVFEVSLRAAGIANLYLRLHVLIDDAVAG